MSKNELENELENDGQRDIWIDVDSEVVFEDDDDDIMLLSDFIEYCKQGAFIDYDGYADELLIGGKIVFSFREAFGDLLYPSDVLDNLDTFEGVSKEFSGLSVVWYNR